MAKVIFTPWRTQSQLLDVRSQFYPPSSYAGPDLRSHACARVRIQPVSFCIFTLTYLWGHRLKRGNCVAMSRITLRRRRCWRMPFCTMTRCGIRFFRFARLTRLLFVGMFFFSFLCSVYFPPIILCSYSSLFSFLVLVLILIHNIKVIPCPFTTSWNLQFLRGGTAPGPFPKS